MNPTLYKIVLDVFVAIAGAIVLVPPLLYLWKPWATRRDKLLSALDPTSLQLYYQRFYPKTETQLATVEAEFKKYFGKNFGRRHYIIPIFLLTTVTVTAAIAGAGTLQVWQNAAPPKTFAFSGIAAAALAGGSTWVVSDLIGRLRRRDFTVSDVYNATFRILLSLPFGWALAQFQGNAQIGIPIACMLGSFPTGTLFTIARRLASSKLGVASGFRSLACWDRFRPALCLRSRGVLPPASLESPTIHKPRASSSNSCSPSAKPTPKGFTMKESPPSFSSPTGIPSTLPSAPTSNSPTSSIA
jgi:hypothetical protein